ncbi:UDP-glucose 4-epimerase [Candidatus Kaiserbacteria bacterium CG10_big_fil_rev_8_21_14_0_10_59_10]|uniref:UDP-glucose 4-epimerase n=1 Tax=Candidatus Kaiserbacteria bacterium CG10_big_fil_rev_8_21_14_0_10_59_10 TaxID=1974612 RepID=A0A2H0U7P3_9BACT|nr:MAG: UDP-glucose 4-epimerase [Candidatus Kaiserbacteria bacterium CG10_big_fil_rev_8_21_14_0_10_59_10]
MKVLVTGGAGFVGSHVVDALLKGGHRVVIVDDLSSGHRMNVHQGVKCYKVALTSPKLEHVFKKERFDAICHLAAKTNMRESLSDPYADITSNILGLVHLLELASKKYPVKKFVFSSTGGALYGNAKTLPCVEDMPANPISPYGVAKLAGEKYLYYYHHVHDLPVVILRYSNVYGPRNERKEHVGAVTSFIQRVRDGKKIYINGNGKQTRDFVYVEDVARANVRALSRRKRNYLVCNISGGVETSVIRVIRLIERFIGKKAKLVFKPAIRGEVKRSILSNKRAKQYLRWTPRYSVEEGVAKTVDHLRGQ